MVVHNMCVYICVYVCVCNMRVIVFDDEFFKGSSRAQYLTKVKMNGTWASDFEYTILTHSSLLSNVYLLILLTHSVPDPTLPALYAFGSWEWPHSPHQFIALFHSNCTGQYKTTGTLTYCMSTLSITLPSHTVSSFSLVVVTLLRARVYKCVDILSLYV